MKIEGKGGISAEVVSDSLANGSRLTTLVLRYPRFIHSEFMTHRLFSRNASSSRAIPVTKNISLVKDDPAMPIHWGRNMPGMQARESIDCSGYAEHLWGKCAEAAVDSATNLQSLGLHKQIVNRVLEPYSFISVIVSATEWDNFFALRLHEDAQPEIQELARVMHEAITSTLPSALPTGAWHLPFITEEEWSSLVDIHDEEHQHHYLADLIAASVARCARVSYLNHDKTSPSLEKDIELADKLLRSRHMSPFEHQATPMEYPTLGSGIVSEEGQLIFNMDEGTTHIDRELNAWSGNFKGWVQNRHYLQYE